MELTYVKRGESVMRVSEVIEGDVVLTAKQIGAVEAKEEARKKAREDRAKNAPQTDHAAIRAEAFKKMAVNKQVSGPELIEFLNAIGIHA